MSLEQEIHQYINSAEFQTFYTKAEETMALVLEPEHEVESLQEHFVEMGRRYNHFIVTITERVLEQSKALGTIEPELLTNAGRQLIIDVETRIKEEFPLVFSFFLSYRDHVWRNQIRS